jgi:NodT family efflux transporter outer membrane factor (OMF) lipoprotein
MQNYTKGSRLTSSAAWTLSVLTAAGVTLAQCGCTTSLSEWWHNGFKVGPNYVAPPVPVPPKWIDSDNKLVQEGNPNIASWWEVFDDPKLNELLHRSYAGSLTLRAAGFQILEARAQRAIACGELFPQTQTFNFNYTHTEVSANNGAAVTSGAAAGAGLAPPASLNGVNPSVGASIGGGGGGGGGKRFFDNFSTNLNFSWELDFWGLFRRNLEAADASLGQSVENYDQALVILLSSVATQYVEYRTLQKRLELARKNVAQQEPLVAQFEQRFKAGIANSFPGYHQLKSNLDATKALIPQLEITLRLSNNQLCVLLGLPVHDLEPELGDGTVPDPADARKRIVRIPHPKDETVVVGIPGELLLRRPDVLAAQEQLRAQSAEIGIAEAEMYPHMGVNGSIGLAADRLAKLFESKSWTGSIGPSLQWNILNYGRLLSNVRFQNYKYQEFVATYQNTILNANQEVENALVGYLDSIEQHRHLQDSADDAAKLVSYLIKQFNEGYLPPGAADTSAFINQIFTAVNFQVVQQDAAAQAEGNIALNLILMYRALGGGWQIRTTDGANPFCPVGPGDVSLPDVQVLPAPKPPAKPPQPAGPPAEMLPVSRPPIEPAAFKQRPKEGTFATER